MPNLDDITIGNWQVFRMNLTGAITPYYSKVAAAFSDTSKGAGKLVKEQQDRVSAMLGLLARMEGKGVTPITRKELEKLESLNVEFRKIHKQVVVWVNETIPFRKDSEKAIKDLGISPKDMKAAAEVSKRSQLKKRGIFGGISPLKMGTAGYGVALGKSVVSTMLGPLASPAIAATGLGYGAIRLGKSIRGIVQRRAQKVSGDVPPVGLAGTPGIAGAPGLAGMPGAAGTGVVEGIASTYPRDAAGRFTARGGLTGIDTTEKSLFKFFNVRAMKARWTKRLLRAAEKRAPGEGSSILGAVGKKGAIAVAATTIAATAFFVGKDVIYPWIEKKLTPWFDDVVYPWLEKLVYKTIPNVIGWITQLPTQIKENFIEIFGGVKQGIVNAFNNLIESIKNVGKNIGGWLKEAVLSFIPGRKSKKSIGFGEFEKGQEGEFKGTGTTGGWVPGFAEGGIVTKPTLGVIGEDYKPEVVTPLSAGNIMDVLKAIRENTSKGVGTMMPAPIDTFKPPFDLADPLLNQLNRTGSLSVGY